MNFSPAINVAIFVALLLLLAQTRHKPWILAKKVLVSLRGRSDILFGAAIDVWFEQPGTESIH